MVVELRIDERLAHGQVCTGWCNFFSATHLIVANDAVAGDSRQKSIMGMGIPQTIKTMFCTLNKAIELINNPKSESHRVFIVVSCPQDALAVIKGLDGKITKVNLGNFGLLYKPEGDVKKNLTHFISLDEKNLEIVREIKGLVNDFYTCTCVGNPKTNIDNV